MIENLLKTSCQNAFRIYVRMHSENCRLHSGAASKRNQSRCYDALEVVQKCTKSPYQNTYWIHIAISCNECLMHAAIHSACIEAWILEPFGHEFWVQSDMHSEFMTMLVLSAFWYGRWVHPGMPSMDFDCIMTWMQCVCSRMDSRCICTWVLKALCCGLCVRSNTHSKCIIMFILTWLWQHSDTLAWRLGEFWNGLWLHHDMDYVNWRYHHHK